MAPEATFVVLAAIFGMPFLYGVVQFNAFVSLRNQIREAWSNIDTELKRRYDLIPNLVETVKAYSRHEQEIFARVAELRAACMANHGSPAEQAADESRLSAAVGQLLAVAEAYPDLKADRAYLDLQRELVNTENRIQAARRFYNGNVRDYRTRRESFPSNAIASLFHFGPEEFLTIEPSLRAGSPGVTF